MAQESNGAVNLHITLSEALREYLSSLKPDQRTAQEHYVRKYVEHAGEQTPVSSVSGSRVESYAEAQIRSADPNAPDRVAALKQWFQFLKKKGYTTSNYGIHIRVRRAAGRSGGPQIRLEQSPVEMTAEGLEARKQELAELKSTRPQIVEAISLAREDKDFRENAPLQAAREQLGMTDGRIKQLEADLRRAVVVEHATDDLSTMGCMVTVTQLASGQKSTFKLVGAREANAAEKKISVESPVGKQLLNRRVGDQVDVAAPRGTISYLIEGISRG